MVQIFGALIFLGVMVIEFQSQFNGNPIYLFLLVFAMVLVWVLSDYMTSKVERVRSDHDWALLEERDKQKAAEK
jgi:drug/metabolite transporter (DMT)-like permease